MGRQIPASKEASYKIARSSGKRGNRISMMLNEFRVDGK